MVEADTGDLAAIRATVVSQLTGKSRPALVNLDREFEHLYNQLLHTVETGNGSSCLILGPRSTGKTLLVNTALSRLAEIYPDFITIKLSGFAQSDDKMALREIARQLDVAIAADKGTSAVPRIIGDYEGIERRSMSETLLSLLALFRPTSQETVDAMDTETVIPPTKSVIFILEELDRFTSGRQTLLYNLLDLTQASNSGVAMLGISARINTRELLEKRVRSRFSQRVLSLPRANKLDDFWAICRASLCVAPSSEAAVSWNASIDDLYKAPEVLALLEHIFYTTKDARQFNFAAIYAISHASPMPEAADFSSKFHQHQRIASTQDFVADLSELELGLLICSARAEVKLESDTLNFNLVYDEYSEAAARLKHERRAAMASTAVVGYRVWSKQVARSAWERLLAMDLVIMLSASSAGKAAQAGAAIGDELKLIKVDVSLTELANMLPRDHPLYSWTRL